MHQKDVYLQKPRVFNNAKICSKKLYRFKDEKELKWL